MARKQKTRRHRNRLSRGGGYSVSPASYVSVGNPIYQQYSGAGKDCADASYVRPGFIHGSTSNGMPGMNGGRRRRGGYQLEVAPFESTPVVSAPGVAAHSVASGTSPIPVMKGQTGGRYEMNPGFLFVLV